MNTSLIGATFTILLPKITGILKHFGDVTACWDDMFKYTGSSVLQ